MTQDCYGTIHRPDCTGQSECTTQAHGDDFAICKARGWGVGTVLEGDEGDGPTRIEIVYLSEQTLLARNVETGDESLWTLGCRCWGEVGQRAAELAR